MLHNITVIPDFLSPRPAIVSIMFYVFYLILQIDVYIKYVI